MSAASDILGRYGNPSLQQMARQRGLDVKGQGKETLINLVAPTLFSPDRIAKALAEIEPAERLLLNRVILAGGDVPTELVRYQLEREGQIDGRPADRRSDTNQDRKGSPWQRGSRKFEDLVARLGMLGLVFTPGGPYGSGLAELNTPGARLVIPRDVLKHLPKLAVKPEVVAAPPDLRDSDPALALRDCYLLLALASQSPIPLTVRGQIVKRALVQIDQSLVVSEGAAAVRSEDELGRIPFLRAVLEELSLLLARQGSLEAADSVEKFLELPAGERLRSLYAAYYQTARWCELFRIDDASIQGKAGRPAPRPVIAARRRILAEIAELPAGAWIPVSHLIERMRLQAYEFLLPRTGSYGGYHYHNYGRLVNPYLSDNALGWTFDIESEQQGWDKVEAGFIRVMVEQPLHWLGAVDLGFRDGRLAAFCITPAGAQLLRGDTPTLAAEASQVVVQPNFQVFAFPPTGDGVLFQLDRFAERVRAEQVVEYRLTRESVYRAQRGGLDTAAIVGFLDRVSTAPLPQNVRRTLEEWGAQHERIVIHRRASLLQAVDEATLDALYADPSLGRLFGRRVAPTAALIPAENLEAIGDHLLASDRLPALSEGAEESSRSLFTVDSNGWIAFRHRVPSIRLIRALRPFACDGADGAMQLTQDSLMGAVEQGLDAEKIIAVLERWHTGPLPPEVHAMVRRWAKAWGRGALVDAVLLQVESPEVLADLMADPEIGPQLQRVPGANALAVVRREAAGDVRSALEGRGMKLEDRLA